MFLTFLSSHQWCRKKICHKLFVDDASMAESVKLKEVTVPLHKTLSPKGNMGKHDLGIPGCWTVLQHRLRDAKVQADAQGMLLNTKKTNLIVFNGTHTRHAIPYISLDDLNPLLCVKEMCLLGAVLDEGLTWWPLVRDLAARCRGRIWALVRIRERGASRDQMVATYLMRIRSVLEYAAPVWGALITGVQSQVLEDMQRQALSIILGREAQS